MINQPVESRARRWQVAPPAPTILRQTLGHLHPTLLQVLYNRGLTDAAHIQGFLEGRYLESQDPFLLPDMDKAVARIGQAIERDETIIVYGDFDADGVSATVLLTEALRGLGILRKQARPYIPDRVDEGYGLNIEALTALQAQGTGLVISVDCGIRSLAEVAHAQASGLDMIVTDHHSLGHELPPALAVINPKRPDNAYPEKWLAGVGIAYKLAQALHLAWPERSQMDVSQLLDLVAVGTVADLAPLLGENRKLVMDGLAVLNQGRRPGLAALVETSRQKMGQISAESIAFFLGPRINAAGRLAHAYSAARLLAAPDRNAAQSLAQELENLNRQRQRLTDELGQHAESLIIADAPILIAVDDRFHPGVVGLVAGRLAEKYYRPSIVIEKGESESRGSCRSIPEFHITDALDEVAHLLVRHGGHAQAAGFTIDNANLPEFQAAITDIAHARLEGRELTPSLAIDAEVTLADLDWALFELINKLEPTGYANPSPVFMSQGVQVFNHRSVGQDNAHLQMEVGDGQHGFRCIAFRQGAWVNRLPRRIDIVFSLGANEWQGRRNLQLQVQDIRPTQV